MTQAALASNDIYLSVVIPCFNEEKRIGKTLSQIITYLNQQSYTSEIRIIDDGSTDRTADICRSHQPEFPRLYINHISPNHGKGYAVRTGMLESKGAYILFSDADLSTPIAEVEKLLSGINTNSADIAIGSRSMPRSDVTVHQPWYRERMGKMFNGFVQYFVLPGFIDTQCGFKLFTRAVAEDVFQQQQIWGFAFDVEILYIAHQRGYRTVEVPIHWENSPLSKVNPVLDSSRMLYELFRIKRMHKDLKPIPPPSNG